MMGDGFLALSDEVFSALDSGRPVVALESTIITHGMPYPSNLETALRLESIVRQNGAVPATVAIINGRIGIGIDESSLKHLAQPGEAIKIGVRDIAPACAWGVTGGTTVSATMAIAEMAGISVFATGGIGGVHRGAQRTMDISSDLTQLAKSPVCVVCAGAKAILDIGLTLEYLETLGVPVIGYRTSEFPAFYTRRSGHSLEWSADTPESVAEIMNLYWNDMHAAGGILLANSIPPEDELDPEQVESIVANALRLAESSGISGKRLTPFLLSALESESHGASLLANRALVEHNAGVAARIAAAHAARRGSES